VNKHLRGGSGGLKMPIHTHLFWRAILTHKVGQVEVGFGMQSGFISQFVHARWQVSVYSSYDLFHPV